MQKPIHELYEANIIYPLNLEDLAQLVIPGLRAGTGKDLYTDFELLEQYFVKKFLQNKCLISLSQTK